MLQIEIKKNLRVESVFFAYLVVFELTSLTFTCCFLSRKREKKEKDKSGKERQRSKAELKWCKREKDKGGGDSARVSDNSRVWSGKKYFKEQ